MSYRQKQQIVKKKKSDPAPLKSDQVKTNGQGKQEEISPIISKEKITPAEPVSIPAAETVSPKNKSKESEENVNLLGTPPADLAMPSLKGLSSLKEKASIMHAEEKKKIPTLDLPTIREFWNEFAENHSSPSLRLTMLEAILGTKGETILQVKTGNQTGKNRLTAETALLDGLRSLIRIPDLQIVVDIDPDLDKSKEIAKPKKLLTSREKFEILTAKNPLMIKLRDQLDLIPDQDE